MNGIFSPLMHTDTAIGLAFSLIVITSSFMIFFKTKEIYELSEHKGIKYFRGAFLFFGLSHFFRLLMSFSKMYLGHDIFLFASFKLFSSIMIYTASVMFIYLFLTFLWKKLENLFLTKDYFIFGFPLIFVILILFQRIPTFFFFFQLLAFFSILIILVSKRKSIFRKKQTRMMAWSYFVIFGSWILIHALEIFSLFFPTIGAIVYVITLSFFIIFIHKVWIHFSPNKKIKKSK